MRLLYCVVVFGVELGATILSCKLQDYDVDVIEEKNAMVEVLGVGSESMSHQF